MKALTLHQPWAQLMALGVKRIETRSWSTSYRGTLAIHAGKRRPTVVEVCDLNDQWDGPGLPVMIDELTGLLNLRDDEVESNFERGAWTSLNTTSHRMPLGAVVATVRLVDVVPIGGGHGDPNRHGDRIAEYPHDGPLPHQQGGLWVTGPRIGTPTRVEDQRPYSDFAPGRFAWLLGVVEALPEPIPAKGKQRLWEWTS